MNIIIIDDDVLVSSSLKIILETDPDIHVQAIGNNGYDAIQEYSKCPADILLMDIRMEKMTGIEASISLIEKYPDIRILFLTTFLDEDYITQALKIGAKGYILKQDFENIIPALKAVYSGQNVFGNEIISKIPDLLSSSSNFSYADYDISEKEMDIIYEIANGLSNKEIAEKLYLSEGTVRNYLSVILEKLDLRDRTQLAIFYYQHK